MPIHSIVPRSGLLLALLAAPGCMSFSFGSDEGDETGETDWSGDGDGDDEPPGPPEPSRTAQPLVDGALWSVRWGTADPIAAAALGEPGLALANGAHAALLDPDNGEPRWGIEPFDDTASALRLRTDELIHGRRVSIAEDSRWELRHHSTAGTLTDTVLLDGYGPLVVDGAGRVFMLADDQLAAFSEAGEPLWTQPLTEEHELNNLFALDDGVVLIESTPWDNLELDYNLRGFDGSGEQLLDTGYTQVLAWINDLALADARTYVAEEGIFGLPGRIHAVEPEFGGLAWTLEFGADAKVRIEPDSGGGVIALIAEQDVPAQVSWIAEDGTVLESRDATTGPAIEPLLVVGAGGELIAGGTVDGEMQLSRLE
jgi:outer membrane protein assembly factor BamB